MIDGAAASGVVVRPGRLPAAAAARRLTAAALACAMSASAFASDGPGQHSGPVIDAKLFSAIARRQNPAIVSIATTSRGRPSEAEEPDVFRSRGVAVPPAAGRLRHAAGSGFIISADGEILTNHHIVDGADTIEVELYGDDGKRYRAVRVGSDPLTDTALIRLVNPPAELPTVTVGDSDALEPGDWIMAIGNPFQLGHTVTVGVISFNGRPVEVQEGRWQDMIQTDAAINPGSSGGPLIDVHGDVVGINVALLDNDSGGSVGIGFAVPMNCVLELLPQLRQGKVVRGQLGVELQGGPILADEARELDLPERAGAIVMTVYPDSAAARAGLRAGDVVVELGGRKVADARALMAIGSSLAPGTEAPVRLFRDGREQTRRIIIEEMPVENDDRVPRTPTDDNDGLTLGDIGRSRAAHSSLPSDIGGALVVNVVAGSAADEAELAAGDIIRAINRGPVHSAAEARRCLRSIDAGRPIFLLVWRSGVEMFLRMRRQ
jgi:serine protease Do